MNAFLVRRPSRIARSAVAASMALALLACQSSSPPIEEQAETAPATPSPPSQPEPAEAGGGEATPPPESSGTALTPDGWGPIRIGMTRAEVVAVAGEDAYPEAVGGPEPEACDEFRPALAPEGLRVMVEQDRVTRITLSAGSDIRTERGFGVGYPAEPIEQAYGADAEVTPHKYSPAPARYITVWETAPGGPDARGLVYEIGTDGRVEHIHAGGPSIQYVEGCL